jgi:hypothetical protein
LSLKIFDGSYCVANLSPQRPDTAARHFLLNARMPLRVTFSSTPGCRCASTILMIDQIAGGCQS